MAEASEEVLVGLHGALPENQSLSAMVEALSVQNKAQSAHIAELQEQLAALNAGSDSGREARCPACGAPFVSSSNSTGNLSSEELVAMVAALVAELDAVHHASAELTATEAALVAELEHVRCELHKQTQIEATGLSHGAFKEFERAMQYLNMSDLLRYAVSCRVFMHWSKGIVSVWKFRDALFATAKLTGVDAESCPWLKSVDLSGKTGGTPRRSPTSPSWRSRGAALC